jgi:hypothetical protein
MCSEKKKDISKVKFNRMRGLVLSAVMKIILVVGVEIKQLLTMANMKRFLRVSLNHGS